MKEVGVVHKIKGSFATVRFERKTACENCNMCLKPRDEMYVELRLKNSLNANIGDKVEVTMGQKAVLASSFIVYVMPLIVMATVLGITYKMELWISLLSSLGSLVISYIGVALIDRLIIRKKANYLPIMTDIINDKDDEIVNTNNKFDEE